MSTSTTPTTPTTSTTPTDLADRHLELALEDRAAGRGSTAAERTLRMLREDVTKLQAIVERIAPQPSPPTTRRPRRLRCPCELGNLWKGVPRARRRHAVLCKLWTPPPSSEISR